MKIVVFGDTHGRDKWKEIVNKEINADKIVFIRDYFDSFDISFEKQIDNFKDILQFKKDNFDKVVLLIGNHDVHYCKNWNETYSGYQSIHSFDIQEILENALKENMLQMCYIENKYLITHAGVSNTWLKNVGYEFKDSLETFINDLFKYKPNAFKFTMGTNFSQTGDDTTQSPIWIRLNSLFKDMVEDFIQIVGHTRYKTIQTIGSKSLNKFILAIDCLDYSSEYLVIENNNLKIEKL